MSGRDQETSSLGITQGISLLSAEVFVDLSAIHTEDLIFSPFHLSAALAVVRLACEGPSAEEISHVLEFPSDENILKKEFSLVLDPLQEPNHEEFTLYSSNKVLLPENLGSEDGKSYAISPKPEFSNIAIKFGVEVLPLNFQDSSAVEEININIESISEGKIRDNIPTDILNVDCKVALISGVYFKGEWKYKFDERSTRSCEFHLNEDETLLVDMMHVRHDKIPYQVYDDLDAQAVTLPFKGDRLSMVVYVPLQVDGLKKTLKLLRKQGRKGVPSTEYIPKSECRVRVYLPRFRIESSLDLMEPLQNLGLQTIFNDDVAKDFGGMLDNPELAGLRVSHIIQKAVIEMDEGGSTAAPARSISSSSSFGPDGRKLTTSYFIADRPFLFHIVDSSTNMILMSGKCTKPEFD